MKEKNVFFNGMKSIERREDSSNLLSKSGFSYDFIKGGWVNNEGEFMISIKGPKRPKIPRTDKKDDLETGEDLKGE